MMAEQLKADNKGSCSYHPSINKQVLSVSVERTKNSRQLEVNGSLNCTSDNLASNASCISITAPEIFHNMSCLTMAVVGLKSHSVLVLTQYKFPEHNEDIFATQCS